MSRSSFSIRRFISPRRSQTVDVDERRHSEDSAMSEELPIFKPRRKQEKSQSWAPSRRQSAAKARRPSREDTLVRRTQSIKRSSPEAIPLPEASPNSSSSSLCSCEGHADTASTNSTDEVLCPPRPPSRASRSSAPKRLADRRHLCIPPLPTQQNTKPVNSPTEADIKAIEAGNTNLEEHPALKGIANPPATPEEGLEGWSLNVQDLIRETDEAFKAVGTAIQEAKIAVSSFPATSQTSRASPAATSPRMESPVQWLNKPHAIVNSTPPLPPPNRSSSGSSASRPRRKKSKKAKRSKTRSKKSARWQLGEEVTDILTGQFFRKIEVNELLSPDYLQAVRAGREAQSRISSDTMRTVDTDGSETPVEPFHLQDLPSRIGAAGVDAMVAHHDRVSPFKPLDSAVRRRPLVKEKSPLRRKPVPRSASVTRKPVPKPASATGEVVEIEDTTPPPPPAKNPLRFAPRPQASQLPTIPEVIVTTPDTTSDTITVEKQATRTFAPVDEDDFIFLHSTNYTLNHPSLRQGQIRFRKQDVEKGMKIDPDDTLDWTAFQMAILGGAGDLFSDPSDFSRRSEAEEVADLVEWFKDFGFENHGLLIRSRSNSGSATSPASIASEYSPMSSVATDIDLPIPVELEYPSGFWNEGKHDTSKFHARGCNIRRWTMEGHHKRYCNRESLDSLPPSPMMDLVMMRGADGEPEMVPMGYNLGHDLGDFLRWEAEHVYATGAY
ncbi:hypothetical protein CkaCkLH20_06700 [Colletotrichum karsti]|uniref:Uncharacterized protein n=1 Tax=Colletotrichum karsti TaxID=1095194 RepID=A0A9P6I1V2_9PEZI|nr:uncharacterized protein CkaCkLH20_06700 [Colletotrichum karsti]KAF9875768.1 hypothetical protein CkaCkLH20_06700 [Colletotrichum karsti]